MNSTTQQLQTGSLPPMGSHICLLYSDFETGTRAKRFADSLVNKMGVEASFTLWRCEMLEVEPLAAAATFEAEGCDFMIVSLPGHENLAQSTKHWLECWLKSAAARGACLVALFDPVRSVARHTGAIRHYLRGIAESAGVGFFAHCPLAASRTGQVRRKAPETSVSTFRLQPTLAALATLAA